MAAQQLNLLKTTTESRHGGGREKGRRKTRRPLTPKLALHVTFRAESARDKLSLLHPQHAKHVETRLKAIARKFHVRVYQYANSGNHLHLLLRGKTREGLQNFFRTAGSQIAQLVTGARKGQPLKRRFWDSLVFTRLVTPGQDFNNVRWYVHKNMLEAEGLIAYERAPRSRRQTGEPRKGPSPPFPAQFASQGWDSGAMRCGGFSFRKIMYPSSTWYQSASAMDE